MCIGTIQLLAEAWEEEGARVGRLEDGSLVTLGFVPDAHPGAYVIVHLGVPVEVLRAEDAESALGLRAGVGR